MKCSLDQEDHKIRCTFKSKRHLSKEASSVLYIFLDLSNQKRNQTKGFCLSVQRKRTSFFNFLFDSFFVTVRLWSLFQSADFLKVQGAFE